MNGSLGHHARSLAYAEWYFYDLKYFNWQKAIYYYKTQTYYCYYYIS